MRKKISRLRLTVSPLNSFCFSCGPPDFWTFHRLCNQLFSHAYTHGDARDWYHQVLPGIEPKKNNMLCFFLLSFQTIHQFKLKKQRLKRLLALLLALSYKRMILVASGMYKYEERKICSTRVS